MQLFPAYPHQGCGMAIVSWEYASEGDMYVISMIWDATDMTKTTPPQKQAAPAI